MRKYAMIVLSYFGFQYPVGGLVVGVTKYPEKKNLTLYYGPMYFQSEVGMIELKRAVRESTELVVRSFLDKNVYTRIIAPADRWSQSTFRYKGLEVEYGKVYGWVVRNARKRFIMEMKRIGLCDGRLLTVSEAIFWGLKNPQYAKVALQKWNSCFKGVFSGKKEEDTESLSSFAGEVR